MSTKRDKEELEVKEVFEYIHNLLKNRIFQSYIDTHPTNLLKFARDARGSFPIDYYHGDILIRTNTMKRKNQVSFEVSSDEIELYEIIHFDLNNHVDEQYNLINPEILDNMLNNVIGRIVMKVKNSIPKPSNSSKDVPPRHILSQSIEKASETTPDMNSLRLPLVHHMQFESVNTHHRLLDRTDSTFCRFDRSYPADLNEIVTSRPGGYSHTNHSYPMYFNEVRSPLLPQSINNASTRTTMPIETPSIRDSPLNEPLDELPGGVNHSLVSTGHALDYEQQLRLNDPLYLSILIDIRTLPNNTINDEKPIP